MTVTGWTNWDDDKYLDDYDYFYPIGFYRNAKIENHALHIQKKWT